MTGISTTFALVTDPQFATNRLEDRWYSRRVVRWLNQVQNCTWPSGTSCAGQPVDRPAGVFVAGDLSMQGGYRPPIGAAEIFRDFRKIYEEELRLPVYMGLGNHDLQDADLPAPSDWYRDYMWDYIKLMHVGYRDTPPIRAVTSIDADRRDRDASWKESSFNYVVELDHVVVVQLHRYGGDDWRGRAPGTKWLGEALADIRKKNKPVIIVQHMGWTNLCDPYDPESGKTKWPKLTADALLDQLRGVDVAAILRGHDHDSLGQLDVTYSNGRMVYFKEYVPGSACYNFGYEGWGASPKQLDAAVFVREMGAQVLYWFRGPQYIRYGGPVSWSYEAGNSFAGGPEYIKDGFDFIDAYFWDGIDAATSCKRGPSGRLLTYFFKGSRYVSFNVEDHFIGGGTIEAGWVGLPEKFRSGLDAVITTGPSVYFIKGSECARWDLRSDSFAAVYALGTAFPALPEPFRQGVKAAVAVPTNADGQPLLGSRSAAYFFRDGTYCHVDTTSRELMACDIYGPREACEIKVGWPGVFTERDGGWVGLVRISPATLDIATGWIDYQDTMQWENVYAVYNQGKPQPGGSFLQLVNGTDGKLWIRRYSKLEVNRYGLRWEGPVAQSRPALALLPVAHDDQVDIIQLYDNNGQLGMYVFAPDGAGRYALGWQHPQLGTPAPAYTWLQLNIDDRPAIIQMWADALDGDLTMRILSRQDDGSYTPYPPFACHQAGPGGTWMACRAGERTLGLLQVWTFEGQVAMTMYTPDGKGGFGVAWTQFYLGEPDVAAWVPIYAGGQSRLVQISKVNSGIRTLTVWTPDQKGVNGKSVTCAPTPDDGPGWFAADMRGNGNQDVVQIAQDDQGRVLFCRYSWPDMAPSTSSPQQPMAGANTWLAYTSDKHKTNIAGLWDNNGILGLATYRPAGEGDNVLYEQNTDNPNLRRDATGRFFAVTDR